MWSGLRILGADGGGTVDRLRELLESLTDLSNSLSGTFSPLLFHLSCQVSLSLAQVNQAFSHTDASAMPGDILCGDIGEVTDMHDDKWPRLGAGHRLGIMRTHDPGCNTQIPWRSWEAPDERPIPPPVAPGCWGKGQQPSAQDRHNTARSRLCFGVQTDLAIPVSLYCPAQRVTNIEPLREPSKGQASYRILPVR